MPHVEFDKGTNRFLVRRRVPVDLQPYLGKFFRHKFKQGVGRQEANDLSLTVLEGFNKTVKEIRAKAADGIATAEQIRGLAERITRHNRAQRDRITRDRLGLPAPIQDDEGCRGEPVEFAALVNDWADEAKKPPATRQDRMGKMIRLGAYLGHTNARAVTAKDLIGYKDHLVKLGTKPTTLKDHVKMIKAMFRWAADNQKIDTNPALSLRYSASVNDEDMHVAFTTDETSLILHEARKSEIPIIRWGNWIAGFLGLRIGDIAEAHTDNFETLGDGTVVFHIRLQDRPITNRADTKVLPRDLPLHPSIVAEGFMDYLRSLPRGPLFPTVRMEKDGRRNRSASNTIAAWMRELGFDGKRKGFHSWRKTVRTILEDKGVSPDRARFIIGHGPKDIDAKHYQEHRVPNLIQAIQKIDDPTR